MKTSKAFGVALIVVGIGLLGYWVNRSFWNPTAEDLRIVAEQADHGGISALSPDSKKIFLLAGVAALAGGSFLLKK
jgi:hypothetical protein